MTTKKTETKTAKYNAAKAKALSILNGASNLVKTTANEGNEDIANRRGGSRAVLSFLFRKASKGRKVVPATDFLPFVREYRKGEKAVELLTAIRGKEGVKKDYSNSETLLSRVEKDIERGIVLSYSLSEGSAK